MNEAAKTWNHRVNAWTETTRGPEGTRWVRKGIKVKHFSADFTAWEEKADHVNFRLVKKDDDALHFGGISFYRRGDDSVDGYIVMKNGDEVREHHLKYQRR